ncbi:MAG TPA: DUF1343 domain-containing protein [Saprospiraceae bacterium]|nr:DUF1343 domain-containing protein [Saprospiraceae bacterium]
MVEKLLKAYKYLVASRTFSMLFIMVFLSACHVRRAAENVIPIDPEVNPVEIPVSIIEPYKSYPIPGANDIEKVLNLIQGKKVGLIVNHTSMVGKKHLVDTLLALNVKIDKIFAPEHGFKGIIEAGGIIQDSALDMRNMIPVVSLYGAKKQPSKEDLDSIDVLIFDIQDVGVRFYTYISTLHYVMESCAELKKPLIILDRPNPNGHYVDGFVLNKEFASYVGMHPIPVVHGLTIGELAFMINGEGWLTDGRQIELSVVKNINYSHLSLYNPPVPPSPNLKDHRAILLYPSTCFFEGTVITEGRGTESPFVQYGHPLLENMPFQFTPKSSTSTLRPRYQDTLCFGFDLSEIQIDSIWQKRQINLNLILEMFKIFPDKSTFFLQSQYIDKLAGTDKLRLMILEGKSGDEIRNAWKEELQSYKTLRKKYLLYKDFE